MSLTLVSIVALTLVGVALVVGSRVSARRRSSDEKTEEVSRSSYVINVIAAGLLAVIFGFIALSVVSAAALVAATSEGGSSPWVAVVLLATPLVTGFIYYRMFRTLRKLRPRKTPIGPDSPDP